MFLVYQLSSSEILLQILHFFVSQKRESLSTTGTYQVQLWRQSADCLPITSRASKVDRADDVIMFVTWVIYFNQDASLWIMLRHFNLFFFLGVSNNVCQCRKSFLWPTDGGLNFFFYSDTTLAERKMNFFFFFGFFLNLQEKNRIRFGVQRTE